MKAVILIKFVFLLTGLINILPVYSQIHSGIEMNTVTIRIIEIGWPGKSGNKINMDTTYLVVGEGEEFGSKDSPYYFRLAEIIDSNIIKIGFTDNLVLVGEPVNYPSLRNPVIISDGKQCFRTRLFDAGTDFCIEVLRVNKNTD
jgi:hypothetical protein